MYTIASVRKMITAKMHCISGHIFLLKEAHCDEYGIWCPICGHPAITGDK